MNLADRIEARFDRAVDSVRKRSGLFDHVWQALVRFNDVLGGRLAAAISYYSFFAAFSLAVLAYSILGRLLGSADAGVLEALNSYLKGNLPLVAETAEEVGKAQVTLLAGVALVISGIGWVEALRSSLRAVWLLDQHPGNWILRRLVDLGMLFGLGLLLGLSLATTGAIDWLVGWLARETGLGQALLRPVGPLLEFVVNVILGSAMLTAVSRMRLSPRRLVTPALVIAVGIQLLNTVGRLVISNSSGRPAYTLVTNAVGLLLYLYVLNMLILFGAALAATATAGTAMDLGGGVAGLGAGDMVETQTDSFGVVSPDAGEPAENVGEPHDPGPEKPR